MYYASEAYIATKMWSSALMKAYLSSTNDDNAKQIVNRHQRRRQGMKPAIGNIVN